MPSLYDLGFEFNNLMAQYEAAETDAENEEIWKQIEKAASALDDKVDAYAHMLRNKEAESDMLAAEIKRLTGLKKSADKLVDRLKTAMLTTMQAFEKSEYKTSIGVWKRRLNPPHVDAKDIDKVPMEYHVPQPDTIDKKAILDLYKRTGEIVDGVDIVRSERVEFK